MFPKGDRTIHSAVDASTLDSAEDQPPGQDSHSRTQTTGGLSQSEITRDNLFSAFSSPTAGLLMCWQYSGSNMKSAGELNRLGFFILDPQFRPNAHAAFSHERERTLIERYLQTESNPFKATHGWRSSSVQILLPHEQTKWAGGVDDPSVPVLTVDGVHHRDIMDIITSVFEDEVSTTFHMTPFEEYWKFSDVDEPIKVFGEAYTSPAYLEADREVHALPREPGDDLERVVAPLMLWSDATHLSNFDASLWPIYLFFGNQSKYTRGKPTAAACHHVAYVPTVR
ncbi:hypothetical protein EV363DRAFT_1176204 [Boletus edulis]|nr:hypothetical protein EV363DRAFT_1179702 [Boletus edulis]KAF8125356.1 hypothetical protein EV363DRAFT_1176204 [Boletus edulis]